MEDSEKMRYPANETAVKHGGIVKEASRLFRERGSENLTVVKSRTALAWIRNTPERTDTRPGMGTRHVESWNREPPEF